MKHLRNGGLSRRGFLRALGITVCTVAIPAWASPFVSRTLTWIGGVGPTGGDWNTTRNWKEGIVPQNGDSVIIPGGRHLPALNLRKLWLNTVTVHERASIGTIFSQPDDGILSLTPAKVKA